MVHLNFSKRTRTEETELLVLRRMSCYRNTTCTSLFLLLLWRYPHGWNQVKLTLCNIAESLYFFDLFWQAAWPGFYLGGLKGGSSMDLLKFTLSNKLSRHKGVFSYIFFNSFTCFHLNGNSMLQMLGKVELLMIR